MRTKKITKATFKSFIKKANENLFIKVKTEFYSLEDGAIDIKGTFEKAVKIDHNISNTFGYAGIWLVGGGNDYFTHYEDDKYIGIEYLNCCGNGIIAIEK